MANPVTFGRLRRRASDAWRSLKERRPAIAHLVRAYQHYKSNHGDHLAAAITYFSFLAIFPLVLLGVSIVAYVLAAHQGLQDSLFAAIYRNVPGPFGDTLKGAINGAIRNRTSVGLIGLAGVLFAGLGWIANLRVAIDTVWGLPPAKRNLIKAKLADLLVLAGLGLGVVVSVGLTAAGTAAGGWLLRQLKLDVAGASAVTAALGIVLGILGSMVVFGWLLIRLPDVQVARRTAVRATLLAAVGFEVLKIAGTYYIARVVKSPAGAAIGPVVGILVWIDLVSRYLLYCVAWAGTAVPASEPELLTEEIPARQRPAEPAPRHVSRLSPVGVAAGLVSTGVAIGAASAAALQRRRHRGRAHPR
ncbi:MAG: rane protein [Pseudonocardiales bacterium]|nr:rane protein [Pseudonocardiales bacterium]